MGLQLKFKVESIRKIPKPYLSKEDGEKKAMINETNMPASMLVIAGMPK